MKFLTVSERKVSQWKELAFTLWPRSDIVGDGEFATILCKQLLGMDEDSGEFRFGTIYLSPTREEALHKASTLPCPNCSHKSVRAIHKVLCVRDAITSSSTRLDRILKRIERSEAGTNDQPCILVSDNS